MNIKQRLADFVSPAPRSNGKASDTHGTVLPPNEANKNRCQFTYSDGRRCANERAPLCIHHGSKHRDRGSDSAPLGSPELAALCSDLTNATSINCALSQVFLLMAQGRISQKQAVAFGYITQLLLQTLPGVRAEFVSTYGYSCWEETLKARLERHGEPDGNGNESPGPFDKNPQHPNDEIVEPNKEHLSEEALSKGPTQADFESLYARTVDLFEGKYDVTPEGRAEARVLNYELELLKSAKSAPPKGRVGEVVNLVRHINKGMNPDPQPAKRVARNFYGDPIPPADRWQSLPGAETCIPGAQQPSSQNPSSAANPLSASTHMEYVSPAPTPHPASPAVVILSESATADQLRITPKSEEPKTAARSSSSQTSSRPLSNAHTTAWFAPASWSGRPQPDPYPSGRETLQTKFRSMANSAFRRMHHQNSRGFWSPGAKHLAT